MAAPNQIDQIYIGNEVLNSSQFNALITDLAVFVPDSAGSFTTEQRVSITGVIDTYFQ